MRRPGCERTRAAPRNTDSAVLYGPDYYASHCGKLPYSHNTPGWLEFYGRIADEIVRSLAPRRVFDAGCAIGFLVEALWDRGVEAHGRDISPYAISNVRVDMQPYCAVGSIAAPITPGYDLVLCIEVLEHMPEADALSAIAAISKAAPRVLFSSSPVDFDEPTHVNVRPTIYWLHAFAEVGFAPVPGYDASFLCPHAVLLERSEAGREHRDLTAFAEIVRQRLMNAEARRRVEELNQAAADVEAGRLEAERRAADALRQAEHRAAEAVRQAERRAAEALRQVASMHQQRHALLVSTSWRVTRPLRAAARLLRRDPAALHRVRTLLSRLTPRLTPARLATPTSVPPDAVRLFAAPALRTEAVDIVVCVHNAIDDVRRCLTSVLACTMPPYRLLIVDDGSNPETAEEMVRFARSHGAVLIRHEQAKGYTLAANAGLRVSTAPWVVLLNSDTLVTDGWLDRMVELGRRDPRIGLIGPLSNTASWQSVPRTDEDGDWAENPLPDGVDVATMAALVAGASARQGILLPFLNGFCLMIRRTVLDDVGLFDEETFGAGYGEENDFCIRARKQGWRLKVADDAYVYHAQSRSYSHERRLKLVQQADAALARKHDHSTDILPQVLYCRDGLGLAGVRVRIAAAVERRRWLEVGRSAWEGKRIAFVLPVREAGGGANVVIQEARAMRRMGVDVWFVSLVEHRAAFEVAYPDFDMPCLWAADAESVAGLLTGYVLRFDAIVATAWNSVFWLPPEGSVARLGYYVQDYEPLFYEQGSADKEACQRSYTHRPDVRMFTKTHWNAEAVAALGVPLPAVVGPSVDIDLFRPAPELRADEGRIVRVCAMLRPSTPRRAAGRTLEVLRSLQARFGARVAISAFGSTAEECTAAGLATTGIENLGPLRPRQIAGLLERSDVFLDFSTWQALGLTALEAMASGCAVVAPRRGGTAAFARDGENALLCDTDDALACREIAARLVGDNELRGRLRRAAVEEAARHPPEAAAFAILQVLFGDGRGI